MQKYEKLEKIGEGKYFPTFTELNFSMCTGTGTCILYPIINYLFEKNLQLFLQELMEQFSKLKTKKVKKL